jgi:hypothetical protein
MVLLCPGSGIKLAYDQAESRKIIKKRGRKSLFREEFILIARAATRFGATEDEIADELKISDATLDN